VAEGSHPEWETKEALDLLKTIVSLRTVDEAERFRAWQASRDVVPAIASLRALAEELGDVCLPLELDVRDRDAGAQLAQLSPPWGEIDLLLNNAGLALGRVRDHDRAAPRRGYRVHLAGRRERTAAATE